MAASARGQGLAALASFNGTNGNEPQGGVTLDANGNLYGTTSSGGANGFGTVWELTKGSGTIAALSSFNGTNGANPLAGATFDVNGNLYGTTLNGGANNSGTVWELAKGSNTITALGSFDTASGGSLGKVTLDANGNLYGTTTNGGANGLGAVWELMKGSSTITALASFNGGTNGFAPFAGVTFDANGNLYGTSQGGGANNRGTVWELAKGSNIASFNGANGSLPYNAGVTLDANGNL
jgi:uncharacterized repeat protein (TIGR03803 family)